MCLCLADNMFELMHKSTKLWLWASLSFLSITTLMSVRSQQITTTENTTWSCEQLDFCSDRLGFEAIEWLFRQLDDDANGNVDITESNEFLRDELKYENGYERHKAFHGNDKQITVDELWKSWKSSLVRNWTVDETVEWLINTVELPQYVEHFQHNAVDGMALPRLAANTQFISILGINNPIHKQKLALKAMDVVLFGAPKKHNFLKDVILVFSLVIAIGGVWFAYVQHKYSQSHLKKMMKDMDTLQKAEEQLMGLQQELDKIREEQQIVFKEKTNLEKKLTEKTASYPELTDVSRIVELEDEVNRLREDLKKAHTSHSRWTVPHTLQLWLQMTHELEIRSFNAKRLAAESQLYSAKEGCERLRKKRSTLLGAFRVAHGSSIDDVDSRILQAKTALSEVTRDLQERLHRWRQIETFCGVPIIQNPGFEYLQTVLYGSPVSGPPGSVAPIGLSRVGSEVSIDEDSRLMSGSIANISIAGFGMQLSSDKTSLLSINNNNTHRKHSNGTMISNSSTLGDHSEDEFDEEDIISLSSLRTNPSFSIGNSTIRDGLKSFNTNESKAHNRSKMMQKSFSEDQESSRLRYERSDTIEADSICHSESCNELQSCDSLASTQKSGNSDSRETNISEKFSSNITKSMDEFENTSNDSNSVKDFDPNSKTSVSTEKKRSLFHGLRKRKTPKQT